MVHHRVIERGKRRQIAEADKLLRVREGFLAATGHHSHDFRNAPEISAQCVVAKFGKQVCSAAIVGRKPLLELLNGSRVILHSPNLQVVVG
jgi:hypothetical protein